MFGSVKNLFGGAPDGQAAGAGAALPYYDNALGYMRPYQQNGLNDYNRYRGEINSQGDMLSQYGNPAAYQWSQAGLSPYDAYQNMMSGYMTSPQAKYQTDQMQKAADRGASASGMLGSGSYFDSLQRNQQDIIAQDQQQWLGNMMGVNQQQMGQIQNFQGQQGDYFNRMKGLTDLGYNAANGMSQIEMQKAMAAAQQAQGERDASGNMLGGLAGLAGSSKFGKGLINKFF